MFVHHCTSCDKNLLTFDSQVISAREVDGGFEATFLCWCGAEQTFLSEGAKDAARELVSA